MDATLHLPTFRPVHYSFHSILTPGKTSIGLPGLLSLCFKRRSSPLLMSRSLRLALRDFPSLLLLTLSLAWLTSPFTGLVPYILLVFLCSMFLFSFFFSSRASYFPPCGPVASTFGVLPSRCFMTALDRVVALSNGPLPSLPGCMAWVPTVLTAEPATRVTMIGPSIYY